VARACSRARCRPRARATAIRRGSGAAVPAAGAWYPPASCVALDVRLCFLMRGDHPLGSRGGSPAHRLNAARSPGSNPHPAFPLVPVSRPALEEPRAKGMESFCELGPISAAWPRPMSGGNLRSHRRDDLAVGNIIEWRHEGTHEFKCRGEAGSLVIIHAKAAI